MGSGLEAASYSRLHSAVVPVVRRRRCRRWRSQSVSHSDAISFVSALNRVGREPGLPVGQVTFHRFRIEMCRSLAVCKSRESIDRKFREISCRLSASCSFGSRVVQISWSIDRKFQEILPSSAHFAQLSVFRSLLRCFDTVAWVTAQDLFKISHHIPKGFSTRPKFSKKNLWPCLISNFLYFMSRWVGLLEVRVRLGHRNRLASNSLSNCSCHSSSIATCRQSLQAGGHCQPLIAAVTFCVTTYLETVPKPGEIWELVKDRWSVRRV